MPIDFTKELERMRRETGTADGDVRYSESGIAPAPDEEEEPDKQRGIFSSLVAGAGGMAKGIAQSVARPFTTPVAGVVSGITGKDVDWGGWGQASLDPEKQARIAGGAALEAAALLPAGKALQALRAAKITAKTGFKALKPLSLAEAKMGAKVGFLGAAGATLGQDERADVYDVLGAGVGGALFGGVIGGAAPVVARGWHGVRAKYVNEAENAFDSAKILEKDGITKIDEDALLDAGFAPKANDAKLLSERTKKKLTNAGVPEVLVNNFERMSTKERSATRELLTLKKSVKENGGIALKDADSVIGRTLMEPFQEMKRIKKESGKAVGDAVRNLPNKKNVDITDTWRGFLRKLDEDGIPIKRDGTLDFAQSKYRFSPNKSDQSIFQQVFDELKPTKLDKFAPGKVHRTPHEIHVLRQAFRTLQEKSSKSSEPLSNELETLLGGLRTELNKPLAALSPKYAKASRSYAISLDGLDNFYRKLGKRFFDESEDQIDMRLNEVLARIVGNAGSDTRAFIKQFHTNAKELGIAVDDEIEIERLLKADKLFSDLLGLTQQGSLQGGVERGVSNVAGALGVAGDVGRALTGRPGALVSRGLSFFGRLTPEKRLKMVEDMLDELDAPGAAGGPPIIPSKFPPSGVSEAPGGAPFNTPAAPVISSVEPPAAIPEVSGATKIKKTKA